MGRTSPSVRARSATRSSSARAAARPPGMSSIGRNGAPKVGPTMGGARRHRYELGRRHARVRRVPRRGRLVCRASAEMARPRSGPQWGGARRHRYKVCRRHAQVRRMLRRVRLVWGGRSRLVGHRRKGRAQGRAHNGVARVAIGASSVGDTLRSGARCGAAAWYGAAAPGLSGIGTGAHPRSGPR